MAYSTSGIKPKAVDYGINSFGEAQDKPEVILAIASGALQNKNQTQEEPFDSSVLLLPGMQPIDSSIHAQGMAIISPIETSNPFPRFTEVSKFEVEIEACRQGYVYDRDLMEYINEDGEGKIWQQFSDELKEKKLTTQYGIKGEISRKSKTAKSVHPNNVAFPNFEEVKSGLKHLMQYDEFLKALEERGFYICVEGGFLSNPDGDISSLEDLTDNWVSQKNQTLRKFQEYGFIYDEKMDLFQKNQDVFTLDALYDTMESSILRVVVESAEKRMGMTYDLQNKCFRKDRITLTTKEVLLQITLMDFGLAL